MKKLMCMLLVLISPTGAFVGCSGTPSNPTPDGGVSGSDDGGSHAPQGTDAGTDTGMDAGTDAGATGTDAGTAEPQPDAGQDAGSSNSSPDSGVTKSPLGKYVMTWYSFQDNTPVNSALSASGRPLYPYISVAVPFRLLKKYGGALDYGDKLYVAYLDGQQMPNGSKHTGWVEIDDFCGDSGDDSYCFQKVGGTKYPNVDLYIGDFTASGMDPNTCAGPAGSGQELTDVSTGDPGSAWRTDYGAKALGSGRCGDYTTAEAQQGNCWDYTPPESSVSDCANCQSFSCTSH